MDCSWTTTTTTDKYVLPIFNIKKKGLDSNAPVVFLQHGLLSSANAWIKNNKNSLSYKLAQEGYNVWVGNNRGTNPYASTNT